MLMRMSTTYQSPKNGNGNGNDIGAEVWLRMMKDHYEKLATKYQNKGMVAEAEVFSNVVDKFVALQKEMHKTKTDSNK
jgi:hypothetical protein